MAPPQKLDIAIAGAGPAGLAAALFLKRAGHRVALFERFEQPAPVGSGLILQPTGLTVLDALGLLDGIKALGSRIDRLHGADARSGRTVLDVRYGTQRGGRFGLAVHRAALFGVLHAAAVAEGVGLASTMLQMTVDYLGTREQFGVKIGSFQALQHRAVDMYAETELLRSISMASMVRADEDDATLRRPDISAAKAQLATSGIWVAQQSLQLHGGIGVTDEHDIGLYFKRMYALNALFGDEAHHVARFANDPAFTEV